MNKNTYTAWAQNDQGASVTIGKEYTNYKTAAQDARAQLGAGWSVHIEDQDGTEILRFVIRNKNTAENGKATHMTIYATPAFGGGYTLTDKDGNEAQEGYMYKTRAAALDAASKLWPSNSVWEGEKVKNGWRIKIS